MHVYMHHVEKQIKISELLSLIFCVGSEKDHLEKNKQGENGHKIQS